MPLNWDVRNFTDDKREALARKIQRASDWQLPSLEAWNYSLCRVHRNGWEETVYKDGDEHKRIVFDRPKPGCRQCGIHFRRHQRISVAWLYFKKRALLADTMGSGKTTSAAGLVAMLAKTGELSLDREYGRFGGMGRAVIVPRAAALHQWQGELQRMIPGINVVLAEGTKRQRIQTYMHPWDVLLIGPEMMRNDHEQVEEFPLSLMLTDDIDQLRNPDTETSYVLDRVGRHADRYVIMTGTPLQKRLPELHAVMDAIGGLEALGPRTNFIKRHVRSEWVTDPRTKAKTEKIVGYRDLGTVKRQIAPLYMRRTAADLDDVEMPSIVPSDVMLDLYPRQRAQYEELRRGVVKILREEGAQTKRLNALSKIHYGSAICAGLVNLGEEDGPGSSVKYDWVIENVRRDGDLGDEKVVVFANLKASVRSLQYRLRDEGIGFVTVWGEDRDKKNRAAAQERFWQDPKCRILLGTRSIEQSLNLQVSRHLINVDTILNPARMEQLAGRVRRDGSAFSTVYVHNLLAANTQEERYPALLEREAALASHVWDEDSELFRALSPMELLELIRR